MIVTIFRHGEAGSAASDRQRELTGQGEDDVGFGCTRFHEICHNRGIVHPQLILHSPWLRTEQTAGIIASAFSHATLQSVPALKSNSTTAAVDSLLEGLWRSDTRPSHLVLVSHQPLVSELMDHYLGVAALVPALPPGGLATLELEVPAQDCGKLLFWAFPPAYESEA